MVFEPFDKIPRLNREMVVTEKLDGTNAQVYIEEGEAPLGALAKQTVEDTATGVTLHFWMAAGSRNRWLSATKTEDNFGFATWCQANAEELFKLGPGRHFGEWWGQGIGRGYGLTEKRFSLFNVGRWYDTHQDGNYVSEPSALEAAPACCHVVPVLLRGPFRTDAVDMAIRLLKQRGSYAASGFMKPEGVIVWHEAARHLFKVTCEKDEQPKGAR